MREIKFRAWDPVNKEIIPMVGIGFDGVAYVIPADVEGSENFNYYPDAILMQFTGLKDKNGKEIYESDLGRINIQDIGWVKCVCVWDESSASFGWQKLNENQATSANPATGWSLQVKQFEVIGNQFEHPELLEAKVMGETNAN